MSQHKRHRASPTIRDVARAAGVSASTVSRAFTRPELLSPATVERIAAITAEMGYSPDHIARSLSTGRRDTVALLVPDIANPFFPPLIKGVERHFQELGVSVLLAETDEEPDREAGLATTVRDRVDGVIIASPRSDADKLLELTGHLPLVLVNRDVPGVHRILIDTAVGVRQAVAHLGELGHTSLAYLAGPDKSWANAQRYDAFARACADLGRRHQTISSTRPDYASGFAAAAAVVASDATAVIAFDDALAQGLMGGLASLGLRVPNDISVIGCDDLAAATTVPPLTSISAPVTLAGTLAASRLEALMSSGTREQPVDEISAEVVSSVLHLRETTAAPAPEPRR